jgi:hypothetical protein
VLRRLFPWVGLVALLVAVVATMGWHNRPVTEARRPNPTSVTTPLSGSVAKRVVRRSALVLADLPRGFRRVRSGGGLSGPSLELCGATFASERGRLAAHRVTFVAPGGRGQVRNTVVAFEPGFAERAVAELEAAAPRCARPVRPSAAQQPDLLALRVRTTGVAGAPRHDLVVERRGDVLSLIDVDDRLGGLTLPVARRLGDRLEQQQPVP